MLIFLLACSDGTITNASPGSDVGIDPGGSQDIGYAREIIESGGIPSEEAFTAEGLFSEHDLPMDGGDCDQLLCPLAKGAETSPVDGRGERLLVELGFDTFMDTFERRQLRLVVTLDISGSMADPMDGVSKLSVMQDALVKMSEQLDADDQLALVTFSTDAHTVLGLTSMDEAGRAAFASAVRAQVPTNSTSIEAGLTRAYGILEPVADPGGAEDRVMLLTDAQPNVDATGTGSFMDLVRGGADDDIGTTVMGVGLDFGSELGDAIAKVRGGNAYYLDSRDTVNEVMGDEFSYIVSPAAYDLDVDVSPADGLSFEEAYGVPLDGAMGTIGFGATTLFFSESSGGLGVMLAPKGGSALPSSGTVAHFSLSYEDANTGEVVDDDVDAVWQGGVGGYAEPADDLGPYVMAALVDEYQALLGGAWFCTGELDEADALARIGAAAERLQDRQAELGDASLGEESDLMEELMHNVNGGQGNCRTSDTYGY